MGGGGGNAYLLNCLLLKRRDGIASKSPVLAKDKQRLSVFTVVENEQRLSVFASSFFASFWIFFVHLFDGLEYSSPICMYMELQRRIAS